MLLVVALPRAVGRPDFLFVAFGYSDFFVGGIKMMKYDLLSAYRDYLSELYRPSTADTYYKKLCTLFEGQSLIDTAHNLDIDRILDNLSTVKHKNRFSQFKNAFLHFCVFQNIVLSDDTLKAIEQIGKSTKKKHRKLKPVDFTQVDKKIKRIRNKKMKLSYQTIIATGLRISELASISQNNCTITDGEIIFTFVGKGGASEIVTIGAAEYSKLYHGLKELIQSTPKDKKLFYSANYLQRQAKELGFACHDLRRAFAKLEYKKCRSKTVVRNKLRHSSIKTTNKYLRVLVKI